MRKLNFMRKKNTKTQDVFGKGMNVSYRKYTGINQKNDPGAKPLRSPIVNDSFVEELDESFDPAKARKGNAKGKKNQGMQ